MNFYKMNRIIYGYIQHRIRIDQYDTLIIRINNKYKLTQANHYNTTTHT